MLDLVYIDGYGLEGSNFYFRNYANKGLSFEDVTKAGLTDDRVQIDRSLIEKLQRIDERLAVDGYRLYIKEGYRSKELYEIVYLRRCEKFGQEITDTLINIKDQPHALGLSVDVCLFDRESGTEIEMRDRSDGTDALFVDYYKGKPGEVAQHFQRLQEYLISLMQAEGFRLGTRREYFHFDYRPESEPNYP